MDLTVHLLCLTCLMASVFSQTAPLKCKKNKSLPTDEVYTTRYKQICLEFHNTPQLWSEAKETCKKSERFLAKLDTVDLWGFVLEITRFLAWDVYWIGAHNEAGKLEYKWSDDTQAELFWGKDPANLEAGHCAVMQSSGYVKPEDCEKKHKFVCTSAMPAKKVKPQNTTAA
ncbi:C-type lectin domain family 2 member D2-like [Physella acuta]|uniref:C-type lectin domain family 2 member D2-like n=1 Tax=Physella acuta TaxID=109671 RepID=UPI0027DC760D|nr:C-type lectin domain family 2 member D2-like [Physella acuta]XP_059155754.1 C-type lectin domain family 2 member D2-like [Physella acuta]XP_059155755.1 C-type lectin domain family 2 member D2-like [Physella acuta]XP_059155756.1 C-type lectin domain family 2 member D2-like [Physella acuta]